MVEAVEEARALMGPDHWPYGITHNRAALEAAARWSHAQALTSKVFTPEELFAPATHGEYKDLTVSRHPERSRGTAATVAIAAALRLRSG